MFGLSFGELVIVAILALVLLGPDQLPDAARTIGKTIRDLKKATDGLKGQIEAEMYSVERGLDKLLEEPPAVPPVAAAAAARANPQPAAPVPATAENVPGLDAALVDPAAPPQPPAPAAEPARHA